MNKKEQEIYAKYLAKMKEIPKTGDNEGNHAEADGLLCELLDELGMNEITEEFRSINKWYS